MSRKIYEYHFIYKDESDGGLKTLFHFQLDHPLDLESGFRLKGYKITFKSPLTMIMAYDWYKQLVEVEKTNENKYTKGFDWREADENRSEKQTTQDNRVAE
jgi:hypothetical protein